MAEHRGHYRWKRDIQHQWGDVTARLNQPDLTLPDGAVAHFRTRGIHSSLGQRRRSAGVAIQLANRIRTDKYPD
jgi:hypothetical protein